MELLRIAAIGSGIVGISISAIAIVALTVSIRDVPARLRALGFVYLGVFVAAVAGILFDLALIGEERLPPGAALLSILLLGFTAIRMRVAASRQFLEARQATPRGQDSMSRDSPPR